MRFSCRQAPKWMASVWKHQVSQWLQRIAALATSAGQSLVPMLPFQKSTAVSELLCRTLIFFALGFLVWALPCSTSDLEPDSSSNGSDRPNIFSEWFDTAVSPLAQAGSGDSPHGSGYLDGPPTQHLLGLIERLNPTNTMKPVARQEPPSSPPVALKSSGTPARSPAKPTIAISLPQRSAAVTTVSSSVQPRISGSSREPLVDLLADMPLDAFDYTPPPAQVATTPRPSSPLASKSPASKPVSATTAAKSPSGEGKHRRLQVIEKLQGPSKSTWRCIDELDEEFPEWEIDAYDVWGSSDVRVGDFVNVVGRSEPRTTSNGPETRKFVVTNDKNLIVLHPDLLLTSTLISNVCIRQSVLSRLCKPFESVRGFDAIRGEIIHKLIQESMKNGVRLTKENLQAPLRQQLALYADDLKRIGIANPENMFSSALSAIQRVSDAYFGRTSFSGPAIKFNGTEYNLRVTKCLEVEERIESLVYGLKGSIDVSVEAVVNGRNFSERSLEFPLEIKSTFRPQQMRQILSYSLLMADRYDRDIKGALVMNVGKDSTAVADKFVGVTIDRGSIVELIKSRNQLASHIARNELPQPAVSLTECEKCGLRDQCAMMFKKSQLLAPQPIIPTPDDRKLFAFLEERAKNMSVRDAQFVEKWIHLISLEEQYTLRERRNLWAVTPEERERRGMCFHNLAAKPAAGANFTYEFTRSTTPGARGQPTRQLFDSSIHENDEVVVSSGRHLALGRGRVVRVSPRSIVVHLKDKLIAPTNTEDDPTSQRFHGFHKPDAAMSSPVKQKVRAPYAPVQGPLPTKDIEDLGSQSLIDRSDISSHVWSLDKDESLSTFSFSRSNVLFMFLKENQSAERLRRLVVDQHAPVFAATPTPDVSFSSGQIVPLEGHAPHALQTASLNPDQMRVISSVLNASDYALILGMPGTGKTSTVAHLVAELCRRKKSVLITGFTHSAVDTLLLKIKKLGIQFCRLGPPERVHVELLPCTFSAERPQNHPSNFQVVATTCWGIEKLQAGKREFDFCLVDEASQLTLPACLGPLRFAKKFVLIGDLYQLPPLVRDPEARAGGLSDSLFKTLSEAHPEAVFSLTTQYRMNGPIMSLSNHLVYHGALSCGSLAVETALLFLRNGLNSIARPNYSQRQHWLRDLLAPEAPVLFVDTDAVPAPEDMPTGAFDSIVSDSAVKNEIEAKIVSLIVKASVAAGVPLEQIGVISPLRAQLRAISGRLPPGADVNTIDKYQGRDKEFIIMSLVRNNPLSNIGTLLQDFRRLNVALTRAKHKLLIIGSRSTFERNHLFSQLFALLGEGNRIYKLEADAHTAYDYKMT